MPAGLNIDENLLRTLWFSELTNSQIAARLGCSRPVLWKRARSLRLPSRLIPIEPGLGWKPIPSIPGYFANIKGQIRGLRNRPLPTSHNKQGYLRVGLQIDGRLKSRPVHRLVCEAFHGPPPSPRHHAAHNDGSKTNNVPSNLRWATAAENCADQIIHGTRLVGEASPRARLTEEAVREIRGVYARAHGVRVKPGTRKALAERYGVSIALIKDVARGKSWKHVVIDLPFMAPPEGQP
jgi:hypothetical protein